MKYLIIRFDKVSKNPIFCGAEVDPLTEQIAIDRAENVGANFRGEPIRIFKEIGVVVVPREFKCE